MRTKKLFTVAVVAAVLVSVNLASASAGSEATERPPACQQPPQPPPTEPPPPKPTTVTTIGQAYYCIFDHHFSGPALDSRALLQPAFAALTQELQRRGLDQASAGAPVLTGRKDPDWKSFSRSYQQIAAKLPDDAARQAVADATITAMVASLNDNHARRMSPGGPPTVPLGIRLSHVRGPGEADPAASGPVFVKDLLPDSAPAKAGIRLGDEIITVNDVPPYIRGKAVQGVIDWVAQAVEGETMRMTLRRPSTGATFSVTMTVFPPPRPAPRQVESKLLPGDVAYVKLPGFMPDAADQVLKAIDALRTGRTLRGVVLDLRGNGGGSPREVSRLTGAWAHGKTISYWCDVKDKCTPNRTDDSVPLVNLPLVTLTDRGCASACDAFSTAVKDLGLGQLVGTRTAGAVSGPGQGYLLNDNSGLLLPRLHEIGANREKIDTVGVPPDHHAPLTSEALSAGRDPGVEKALSLLK